MTKVVLGNVLSTYDVTAVNANFAKIEDALNNKVLYREPSIGDPNSMNTDLDMNGKRILNVPAPINPTDLVRMGDIGTISGTVGPQGPQGVPGPIGPQGLTGPAGSGGVVTAYTAIADENILATFLIYIKSNGHCALASSATEGKEAIGFVTTTVSSGATASFYTSGNVITGLSGLTPGASYYMSTGGSITLLSGAPTATGNVLMKVGTAISVDKLVFSPEAPVTL